jgi:starch-binding outer membrane protein SusE/F
MKNIFKTILAFTLAINLTSCEDESNLAYVNEAGDFRITSPTSGSGVVLNADYPTNPALTVTWESADYGTPTAIDYSVEVALAGTSFAEVIEITTTNNTYASVTVDQLNGAAVGAGLTPFTEGGIDVRIKSSIGTNSEMVKYSNTITYLVTPYSTELPQLAVPGNHQGWNPPTAPRIASSAFGETDYEGYLWLDGGFKFVAPDAAGNYNWGNTDWGDDTTFSGALVATGETDCTATAGFYRVKANTTDLTYDVAPVSWGIIGAATPTGWDSDTDLVYNPSTRKLEIASIALTPGAFKFRGNNAWSNGFDLGTVNADGYLIDGGDLTFNGPAGNYKVVLDLSNPRKYTYELIAL